MDHSKKKPIHKIQAIKLIPPAWCRGGGMGDKHL